MLRVLYELDEVIKLFVAVMIFSGIGWLYRKVRRKPPDPIEPPKPPRLYD